MNPSPLQVLNCKVHWETTSDPEFPLRAVVDASTLLIRVNDFPRENLYTLIIDGEEVLDLEEWPANWERVVRKK